MENFNLVDRLHTDVLAGRYGPITALVVRHDAVLREAHLIDRYDISRTYALTFLSPLDWDCGMRAIDEELRRKGHVRNPLIGETFRTEGYNIRKNVIDAFIQPLPGWLAWAFDQGETDGESLPLPVPFAKARLAEFLAKKENEPPRVYGTVLEVYSPDFRDPILNGVDIAQINPALHALEQEGITRDEVWRRLGENNDWSDIPGQRRAARLASLAAVESFRSAIRTHLGTK